MFTIHSQAVLLSILKQTAEKPEIKKEPLLGTHKASLGIYDWVEITLRDNFVTPALVMDPTACMQMWFPYATCDLWKGKGKGGTNVYEILPLVCKSNNFGL